MKLFLRSGTVEFQSACEVIDRSSAVRTKLLNGVSPEVIRGVSPGAGRTVGICGGVSARVSQCGKLHKHFQCSPSPITECVKSLLYVLQWEAMRQKWGKVDAIFPKPLHGQWIGAGKVRVQAGDDLRVFPHC